MEKEPRKPRFVKIAEIPDSSPLPIGTTYKEVKNCKAKVALLKKQCLVMYITQNCGIREIHDALGKRLPYNVLKQWSKEGHWPEARQVANGEITPEEMVRKIGAKLPHDEQEATDILALDRRAVLENLSRATLKVAKRFGEMNPDDLIAHTREIKNVADTADKIYEDQKPKQTGPAPLVNINLGNLQVEDEDFIDAETQAIE